jgi:ribosomal protein L29
VSKLKERRQQIQQLSVSEAQKELKELRLKLFNLRLQQQRGEVKNSRVFAETRKDIARLLHRLGSLEREMLLEHETLLENEE